jgi:hypothetical protein
MTSESREFIIGLLLWALIFYPVWSPRCRRLRREARWAEATAQVVAQAEAVTRRAAASGQGGRLGRETGPNWEQDKPFPECFDQEIEDDL